MLFSVAMCLNIPAYDLIGELGHNGTEILWDDREVPTCFRGFHESEMAWLCYIHGYSFTTFDLIAYTGHNEGDAKEIILPYNLTFINNNSRIYKPCKLTQNMRT